MNNDRTIKETVRRLSGVNPEQVTQIDCEVVSVNIAARTCSANTLGGFETVELDNISLMASVDDGVLIVPVIGSTIKVMYSTYQTPFVCQFSGVDRIILIGATNIQLMDGSLGGLVKVADLVNKLNNIENLLNKIVNALNGWTPVPNDGGGALKTAISSAALQALTDTVRADIENTKITQGS